MIGSAALRERTLGTINNYSKAFIGIIAALYALFAPHSGMAVDKMKYLHPDSRIISINVPGKLGDNMKKLMAYDASGYTLTLKGRDNMEDKIGGTEIRLKYDIDFGFVDSKDRQYPNILSRIFIYNEDPRTGASYDKRLLNEKLDTLSCLDEKNIIEPRNPIFIYSDGRYAIADEINGNRVERDILYRQVVNAILTGQTVLDLEEACCYVKPRFTSESQRAIEVRDTLNKYVSSKITYTFGEYSEVIDGSIINMWLSVDDNLGIAFDEEGIRAYLTALSNKYKGAGRAESFVASSGKTLNIGGLNYDTVINIHKETQDLIAAIKSGASMTKEPAYIQSSYVEIDLANQHLWFYKDGLLIAQGDIVSGCLSCGMATPEGVYRLYHKTRNAVLRGPGYAAPVDFWMPFNGGIGIHDATWRHAFGGSIYMDDGSHGCINCPYSLAETIFNNIDPGTLVICYY